jgi:hypothetical protein
MTDLTEERVAEIRARRLKTFLGVWSAIKAKGEFPEDQVTLSKALLNEVVEHYIMDVRIMRRRYNITDNIQLHKIAGLTTCALMRFRPIVPLKDEFRSEDQMYANETFAIIHGIAICGEYTNREGELKILEEPWFEGWYNSFRYLLHFRNYTAESIIFAYETITRLRFPENFDSTDA